MYHVTRRATRPRKRPVFLRLRARQAGPNNAKSRRTRINFYCALATRQWKQPSVATETTSRQTNFRDKSDLANGLRKHASNIGDKAELGYWWCKGGFGEGSLLQLLFDFQEGLCSIPLTGLELVGYLAAAHDSLWPVPNRGV